MLIERLNIDLTTREQDILRSIVNFYVLKAVPVGSRKLSKYLEGKQSLSPATLRNIMSDLEESGLIDHPHTSAGRIPTDKGYRYYVDSLMETARLSNQEIKKVLELTKHDESDEALKHATKVLGALSNYLSIVRIPQIIDLKIIKIEIISVSSDRLLIVLALDSNIVRTATLELNFQIEEKYLESIRSYLNDRITGKSLKFVRENFSEIIKDMDSSNSPLIRLFLDSTDKIFKERSEDEKIITSGANNLLQYPEFEDIEKVKTVIELVENQDMVVHLLDKLDVGSKVLIGSETGSELLEDYSIVLSKYKIGNTTGSIGLIGPKRMNYAKMMALVNQFTEIISD